MCEENDSKKPSDNMESLKRNASACGPGCGCNSAKPSSRCRWLIGVVVLAAAGVLVARAMVKNSDAPADAGASEFVSVIPTAETPPPASEAILAIREITAISDLNTAAADTDAVFVYLPGKDEAAGSMPSAPIQSASQTIKSNGDKKIGVFTLKVDAPEYAQFAAQGGAPGVLAMVKGRGMAAVSGEITEAKLIQAFVSASSAGGCGPSAGSGCCPK